VKSNFVIINHGGGWHSGRVDLDRFQIGNWIFHAVGECVTANAVKSMRRDGVHVPG
jgi:hypothetical protein